MLQQNESIRVWVHWVPGSSGFTSGGIGKQTNTVILACSLAYVSISDLHPVFPPSVTLKWMRMKLWLKLEPLEPLIHAQDLDATQPTKNP